MLQKDYFSILASLSKKQPKTAKMHPENSQKPAKIDHKWRKLAKFKPFDEIFWNLVSRCFLTKENATKKYFSILAFLAKKQLKYSQKTAKIDHKWRKLAKLFDNIFWNLVCKCFPTKEKFNKKTIFRSWLFWPFFAKKQSKLTKNEENWQNPNLLIKCSEFW